MFMYDVLFPRINKVAIQRDRWTGGWISCSHVLQKAVGSQWESCIIHPQRFITQLSDAGFTDVCQGSEWLAAG